MSNGGGEGIGGSEMAFQGLTSNPVGSTRLPVHHVCLSPSQPLLCGDPCDLYRKPEPRFKCLSGLGLLPPGQWGGKKGSCVGNQHGQNWGWCQVPQTWRRGDERTCSLAEPGPPEREEWRWGAGCSGKPVEGRHSKAGASEALDDQTREEPRHPQAEVQKGEEDEGRGTGLGQGEINLCLPLPALHLH